MRTHECRAGQFVVKPPGETHCDAFSSPGRAIALEIAVQSLDQFGMFVPGEATYTQNEEAHSLAWHIARELRGSPGPASLLALEGLALELIAASARPKRTPARDGPSWLRRLVEMLQDSPCDLPTVTAMAQTVDVHPAYLARVFKTYYRRSLGVFARQLRLQWAAQRLVSTTEPVAAIAQAAGFYDQSHFSRAFFAETGFTPSRYRRLFGARSAP